MSGSLVSIVGAGGLFIAALAIEAGARRSLGPATAAQALSAAMRTTPGRAIVLLTWLWVGVHFLAR